MFRSGDAYLLLNSLKTTKALTANTIEAASDGPEIPRPDSDAQRITHKSSRAPRERGQIASCCRRSSRKNDHTKGREHATEAQKHSKVASAASDDAHAKSSSKKKQLGGQVVPGLPSRRSITRVTSVVQQKSGSYCAATTRSISCRNA